MPTSRHVPFHLPTNALVGKVVVITGSSRGLGAGLAKRFAEQGAALGLCARVEPKPPPGSRAVCAVVDVTDPAAVEGFAGAVGTTLGPVDLWINNAGVLDPMGPQRDHDPVDVAMALNVNIGGVANGTRTFSRRARSWPAGRRVLVNISSGAARTPYEGWSIYGATKAAVEQFTQVVALEEPDLVCHAISPGVVETDMQVQIRKYNPVAFPAVGKFRQIHADRSASTPAWVADHITAILLGSFAPDDVIYRVPDESSR